MEMLCQFHTTIYLFQGKGHTNRRLGDSRRRFGLSEKRKIFGPCRKINLFSLEGPEFRAGLFPSGFPTKFFTHFWSFP
jgi:hypothetical protein